MSEADQSIGWIETYRNRTYETRLASKTLTSLRRQYFELVDLQNEERPIRWNADYDMKRRPVNVRDIDGLLAADTEPWQSVTDFYNARDALDDWRASQRRVLKTAQDFYDWERWSAERPARRATGTHSNSHLSPVANAVLKALAHRFECANQILASHHFPSSKRPNLTARTARLMADLTGENINEMTVKNARRRGAGASQLRGSIQDLSADDRTFLSRWFGLNGTFPEVMALASMLCASGSAAAVDLAEIEPLRPSDETLKAILIESPAAASDGHSISKVDSNDLQESSNQPNLGTSCTGNELRSHLFDKRHLRAISMVWRA